MSVMTRIATAPMKVRVLGCTLAALAFATAEARASAPSPGAAAPARADAQGAAPATVPVPATVRVKRLYTGPDGESHLDEVDLPTVHKDAGAVLTRLYTTDTEIGYGAPGQFIDWHIVSTPRFLIVLQGQIEIGLGDGSKHVLVPGDIVLASDTSGRGHTSRTLGDVPVLALTVRLPKEDPLRPKQASTYAGPPATPAAEAPRR
jgi:hypothetical protein